jgi:hypothetical protein
MAENVAYLPLIYGHVYRLAGAQGARLYVALQFPDGPWVLKEMTEDGKSVTTAAGRPVGYMTGDGRQWYAMADSRPVDLDLSGIEYVADSEMQYVARRRVETQQGKLIDRRFRSIMAGMDWSTP